VAAGVTLCSFVILLFTGDFAHHLNVAAVDYAGAREHASNDAFEKKQSFEPRRMDSLWFGGVMCGSLYVSSLLLLSGQESALRTENTAGGQFIAR
jgi:hypothetical protein